MGDGFYRSKDPTNSIKVLKENLRKIRPRIKTEKKTNSIQQTDKSKLLHILRPPHRMYAGQE